MKRHPVRNLVLEIYTVLFGVLFVVMPAMAQTDGRTKVSFQTEDGWTIYGTLFLPKQISGASIPGVVVLSEPGWVVRMIHGANICAAITSNGMAALAIDMRGSAASYGKKDFELFSQEELDGFQLDIRAAVKFLGSQKGIDPRRIGVLGAGITAEYVVREASRNTAQIKAIVLLTGSYSSPSREFLKSRRDLPVLAVVGKEDPKESQTRAAEPYFLSPNKYSHLILAMDRGASMFNRPGHLKEQVSDWLKHNLRSLGDEADVSFKSSDGWELRGNLYLPDGADGKKVPAVVFVHGINHDQQTWYYLAREVVRGGMAALIFDWRGNRKSIRPDGKWEMGVDLPRNQMSNMYQDVKAAIQFMASQQQVDANRIALVAATATNNFAVRAMMNDARIKTFVGLSFYAPDADVKKYIQSSDVPFFIIASTNDMNADGGSLATGTREVYAASKSKDSTLLMYDDAGRGSDMLKTKPELFGMIVRWLQEKTAN
ncbi:MAG: dienelactone hydrolase family protein [Acidobacteria bacterium]|nr:dienelactone hydrolase family protein [Acidobacteriota bacterium]